MKSKTSAQKRNGRQIEDAGHRMEENLCQLYI
jgi:hypothetical protein